jgi:hypothetical protein
VATGARARVSAIRGEDDVVFLVRVQSGVADSDTEKQMC